jgi:hypothetical protein
MPTSIKFRGEHSSEHLHDLSGTGPLLDPSASEGQFPHQDIGDGVVEWWSGGVD